MMHSGNYLHYCRRAALAIFLVCVAWAANARGITMSWSPVGNAGNAPDPATGSLFGAVNYSYNIGTYDVTNAQYVAFLNANDPDGSDPLTLYNSKMSDQGSPAGLNAGVLYGGIDFAPAGVQGNIYSVISGWENKPVNCVSWFDAIRFANWMDNGQPVFTTEPTAANNATENGSYTLNGFEPTVLVQREMEFSRCWVSELNGFESVVGFALGGRCSWN